MEELENKSLEQSNTDSNELNFESENDLVESIRNQANEMRDALTQEPSEDTQSDNEVVEEQTEENQEENNDKSPDGEIDLADWLDKFELPHEVTLKSKGLETKTNKLSELFTLANAGLDYTKKRQEEAPLRKFGEYAQQQNITMEDLQLLADVKRGDKQAVGELAKRTGVDIYDIDTDASYKPSESSHFVESNEADEIANEIVSTPELFNEVQRNLHVLPRDIQERIVSDASLLSGFRDDIVNGIAQKVIPEVIKRQSIDTISRTNVGKNFFQYYVEAVEGLTNNQAKQQEVQQVAQPQVANAIDKAKAGVSSTKITTASNAGVDIWSSNLSPDELVAQIKLQAQMLKG